MVRIFQLEAALFDFILKISGMLKVFLDHISAVFLVYPLDEKEFEFLPFLSLRGAQRRSNLIFYRIVMGIASSAIGLLAMTNGAFFKGQAMNSAGTSRRRITSRIFLETLKPIEHFTGHSAQSPHTRGGDSEKAKGPGNG